MAARDLVGAGDVESTTPRKLRRRLIPLLFILYVVAYLDRINIGFASLTMNAALGITNAQYGLLVGVFFWGYFLFEVPSNLLLHKIGARVWIARILISWGIVAALTGAVHSVPQLYMARFLLGVAEAGFFPGIVLYVTYWFRQREQAQVIALFVMALPVASILGAPVSGFILDHAHWAALSSWRWLLILEGFPAIVCGLLAYFLLPSRPSESDFLTDDEKRWINEELGREGQAKFGGHSISAVRALVHPRVWHLASALFAFDIGLYAMSFYMPQSVKSLSGSYSNTAAGVLVMIPHLAGLAAMILVSRSSDRRRERRFHAAFPLINHRRHGIHDVKRNALPLTRDHALVDCRDGNLQFLRAVLLDSEQVPSGIVCGLGHRLDQFSREPGRVCGASGHRSRCPREHGNLRWPRSCRRFAICIGDSDTAAPGNEHSVPHC